MIKLTQKDLITLAVAVFAGIILSVIAEKYVFSNAGSKNTQVDVVPAIHTDFPTPPSSYFNNQAIDPTQIINIAPNSSQQSFNTPQ